MTAGPILRIERIGKAFGGVRAVDDLSLDVERGEFFALLGPSGCGKTTLMRMIAGFETPDRGRVIIDGEDIAAAPPHRRPVNMMFQSYALFPHMSVARNIAYGLVQEGLGRADIAARVADMLRLTQLSGLENRKPAQLSGGQRQRVALARALVKRPKVLLLDEPLGALDRKLREEAQFELAALQQRLGLTFVVVTHDQDEAMAMASRIAVMRAGRIAQIGAPAEVYDRPATRYVAEFIGEINIFEGEIESGAQGALMLRGKLGTLRAAAGGVARPVAFALRPDRLRLSARPPEGAENVIAGVVRHRAYLGDATLYRIEAPDGSLLRARLANAAGAENFMPGDAVACAFAAADVVLLGEDAP